MLAHGRVLRHCHCRSNLLMCPYIITFQHLSPCPFWRFCPNSPLLWLEASVWLTCQCLSKVTQMCSDSAEFSQTMDTIIVKEQSPHPHITPETSGLLPRHTLLKQLSKTCKNCKDEASLCCYGSDNATLDSTLKTDAPSTGDAVENRSLNEEAFVPCLVLGPFRLQSHPCLERGHYHSPRLLLVCFRKFFNIKKT